MPYVDAHQLTNGIEGLDPIDNINAFAVGQRFYSWLLIREPTGNHSIRWEWHFGDGQILTTNHSFNFDNGIGDWYKANAYVDNAGRGTGTVLVYLDGNLSFVENFTVGTVSLPVEPSNPPLYPSELAYSAQVSIVYAGVTYAYKGIESDRGGSTTSYIGYTPDGRQVRKDNASGYIIVYNAGNSGAGEIYYTSLTTPPTEPAPPIPAPIGTRYVLEFELSRTAGIDFVSRFAGNIYNMLPISTGWQFEEAQVNGNILRVYVRKQGSILIAAVVVIILAALALLFYWVHSWRAVNLSNDNVEVQKNYQNYADADGERRKDIYDGLIQTGSTPEQASQIVNDLLGAPPAPPNAPPATPPFNMPLEDKLLIGLAVVAVIFLMSRK